MDRIPWRLDPATLAKFGPKGDWDPDQDKWELYNLDSDFTQAEDLAARHPEKLAELKALFWEDARKYQVTPLLSGFAGFFGFAPPAAERTEFTFYPGTQDIGSGMIPHVYNRSLTVDTTAYGRETRGASSDPACRLLFFTIQRGDQFGNRLRSTDWWRGVTDPEDEETEERCLSVPHAPDGGHPTETAPSGGLPDTSASGRGASFTIRADLEIPPSRAEGVIVAEGDAMGGFALYLRDGRLQYT
jgi:hypothetical protein